MVRLRGITRQLPWRDVGFAVLVTAGTLAAAFPLSVFFDEAVPLLLLVAVALAGWEGGLVPALVATVLGAIALDVFFEGPSLSLTVSDPRTVMDVGAFLAVSLLFGSVNARMRGARQRAEGALRARDEALAVVSHDLRTPLTAIKASVVAIRDREKDLDASPELRAQLLANIEAEVDRLTRFVAESLALQRLEAGLAATLEWSEVGDIVSAVIDRCEPSLGSRQVEFAVPETLPLARFDGALLDQALTKLVENAAAHTPEGSRVVIAASIDAGRFRIEVRDSGPGVRRGDRERIFQKLERGADGVSRTTGLGLGLAIARAAVIPQGGCVWAEEAPEGGAAFIIEIPVRTRQEEVRAA